MMLLNLFGPGVMYLILECRSSFILLCLTARPLFCFEEWLNSSCSANSVSRLSSGGGVQVPLFGSHTLREKKNIIENFPHSTSRKYPNPTGNTCQFKGFSSGGKSSFGESHRLSEADPLNPEERPQKPRRSIQRLDEKQTGVASKAVMRLMYSPS